MKHIEFYDDFEDFDDSQELFQKKDSKKLHTKRSLKELYAQEAEVLSSISRFTDPDLQNLFERGYINELLAQLQSGKEATVYLVDGPKGLLAAKVYADIKARSFKNDQVYREGRFIGNAATKKGDYRIKKAIEQRSDAGLAAQKSMWVGYEYYQLWSFYKAGIPVPKPMVGPYSSDISMAGAVVLMEYLGDESRPAPRLSDIKLEPLDAENAFKQSVTIMTQMLEMNKVHGDYSTYNLLWWQGKVYVIDLPQVIDVIENPRAWELLKRDCESLCTSFRKLGIEARADSLYHRVRREADWDLD